MELPFRRRRSRSVAALDIGASSLKFVRLDRHADGLSLSAAGIRELPTEAIVAHEIKDRDAIIFNIQSIMNTAERGVEAVLLCREEV